MTLSDEHLTALTEALREIAALRLTAGVYRIAHTALRDLGADE